jgi:hypothetical protein
MRLLACVYDRQPSGKLHVGLRALSLPIFSKIKLVDILIRERAIHKDSHVIQKGRAAACNMDRPRYYVHA